MQDGTAALLYISPEMLRSATIERILLARNVVRFVIDEAHCFSSWGQDFRVDYLYIGHFIRKYQQKKGSKLPIPVSCFTATAKQKVIQDIRDYFKQTLDLNLELFASKATRTNLSYSVLHVDNDEEKYQRLRELIADSQCPTIVYVSRTRRTRELASRLTHDGFRALPFNGKMDSDEKITNQDAFMNDYFRVYTSGDVVGVELAAALKNVIALSCGVCDGLGYQDNTKALLMTRAMAEITRLGEKLGGSRQTFGGLAGMGDLIVTCTSMHSRNRRAGILIGQGKTPREAMEEVGAVVEGYFAAESIHQLSERVGVEMPISRCAYEVLYQGKQIRGVVAELMTRAKKDELLETAWL